MSDNSKIEWTDATWNPIRAKNRATGKVGWFCAHVSPGCANCYAEPINRRLGTGVDYKPSLAQEVEVFLDEAARAKPLDWRRPRKIFVGSMTDLFADFVTDAMLDRVFAVMALCPGHLFQLLTKRPERMRAYLSDVRVARRIWESVCDRVVDEEIPVVLQAPSLPLQSGFHLPAHLPRIAIGGWPLRNVWLGVSVEDQSRADERIPILLDTPAALRWISAEPLLGAVDLTWIAQPNDDRDGVIDALLGCDWIDGQGYGVVYRPYRPGHQDRVMTREVVRVWDAKIDWVVAGGESGPGARPMHPDWARSLRDQCEAAKVPFLFKQNGEWVLVGEVEGDGPHHRFPGGVTVRRIGRKQAGRTLDGVTHDAFPEARP